MRTHRLALVTAFVVGFGCGGSVIERNGSADGAGGSSSLATSSNSAATSTSVVVGSSVNTGGVGGSTGDVWSVGETAGLTVTVGNGGSTGDVWGVGGSTSDIEPVGPVGSTGVGGGSCTSETHETLALTLQIGDAPPSLGCSLNSVPPTNMDVDIQGTVVQLSGSSFTVYTCPPGTTCGTSSATVNVDAPGLMLSLPKGAFVDVHIQQDLTNGCADMIVIRNLPTWQGMQNPAGGGDTLWLEAADGTLSSIPGAPVTVTNAFECTASSPQGSCVDSEYDLVFSSAEGASTVGMGQSGLLSLSAGSLSVHNMRSFIACGDGPGSWGYWMVPVYFL